ncbi:myb-like protein F [Eurosta solidaginis]|uniref:myb-like protein F n=1 Tax=Eurosta solidaginis TaxID=178769 RepID=UPI00353091BE
MSNTNYIDRVPVKISEKFKPPPKLYQLPQVIANRLQLPVEHYDASPHYDYDFQLERKVLAKIPEWRRMRQQDREARRERKERREQEHLFQIEAKNKEMLGAVTYPSTDDLSSSDNDSVSCDKEDIQNKDTTTERKEIAEEAGVLLSKVNSFHTILQPTIISASNNDKFRFLNNAAPLNLQSHNANKNGTMASVVKDVNAFNYRDFEEDTSSPFDTIELKTINDLDILAQVLHNTQLPMKLQNDEHVGKVAVVEEDTYKIELKPKDNNTHNNELTNEEKNSSVDHLKSLHQKKDNKTMDVNKLATLKNTEIAIQKVEFENLGQQVAELCNECIPNITNNSITGTKYLTCTASNIPTACTSIAASAYAALPNQQTIQCYQMPYNSSMSNVIGEKQQHYANFNVHHTRQGGGTTATYENHNYLHQRTNFNENIPAYCSPRHLQYHNTSTIAAMNSAYACNNANNYGNPTDLSSSSAEPTNLPNEQNKLITPNNCNEIDVKSKSVPDILRELSAEVRNSEIRRSRYYSFSSEEEKQSAINHVVDEDVTPKQSPTKVPNTTKETNYYAKLPRPAQRLVKKISSMGFPLERVAKISQIFGIDDKKIIEHLIPLSELMDLGFDESKISEALIQFDNNKEKALEYLIS